MIHFVMVRVGTAYGPEYVSILADMIARNASLLDEFAIWCVTDQPDELPEGVGYIPADPSIPPSYWAKLQLFSPAMPWAPGERIVYFDLDVCITGRLEDMVERKGIIRDWNWPCFNSSVMVWDHGEHEAAWDLFSRQVMDAPIGVVPADLLPLGVANGGDQEWLTYLDKTGQDPDVWAVLPPSWCLSYRKHAKAWPPNGCKVVVFHGQPKPPDVEGGWVEQTWRIGGLTSLPELKGVNVTHEHILENVRAACERDLDWFTGFGLHKRTAVIVGGAPSLTDNLPNIRAQRRRGAWIVSVNNAWRPLVECGVVPDVHVMLDAREDNAAFLEGAPAKTRYLIASQCHPAIFEALKDRDVTLWHNAFGDGEAMREALGEHWDNRPCVLIPGGGTVGLRALWLCFFSGFRTIHVYGMDSSYEDGRHHAYPQALNDGEAVMDVTMAGKHYRAARWMVRQAEEFRETWSDLRDRGVTIHVHGRGLLPDIARKLRSEARAA